MRQPRDRGRRVWLGLVVVVQLTVLRVGAETSNVDIEGEPEPPSPEPPAQPHRLGPAPGTPTPGTNGTGAGRTAGRGMPRTDSWPEPPTPTRETAAPGDGSVRGDRPLDD